MNKSRKYVGICIAVVLTILAGLLPAKKVFASGPDPMQKGSIQVELNDLGTDRQGVEIVCMQVASAVYEEGLEFVTKPEFASVQVDYKNIKTGKEHKEIANRLMEAAKTSQVSGLKKTTDSQGIVLFEGLEQGVYLVMQGNTTDYGTFAPFLVFLPYCEDGAEWIYNIKAEAKGELPPKPEESKKPEEPEKPEQPEKPEKPQTPNRPNTGDEMQVGLYLVLMLLAVAGIIIVSISKRKKV